VNLRDQQVEPETFAVPSNVPLDINLGVRYQVRNLVADDSSTALWPEPRTANDIFANGVDVNFSSPNEVQYLRLERVR
jgi:hypothetical protein